MSLRLSLLQRVFPSPARLGMLDRLAQVTAQGFGVPLPTWGERSFRGRLAQYAAFTAGQTDALFATGEAERIAAVRESLYEGAADLGRRTRRLLGVGTPEEAFAALTLLYRQIGIELSGGPTGAVMVSRCFFARYYSEPVCGLIDALDRGVVAGLYGGASLSFSERLTAGRPSCRALVRESVGARP